MKLWVVALTLAAVAASAAPASAAFPGRNGTIAVVVEDCDNGNIDAPQSIRAYSPSGRRRGRLTRCTADRSAPAWSADGKLLAFVEHRRKRPRYSPRIAVVRRGRRVRTITAPPDVRGGGGPQFGRSGRRLLYLAGDGFLRFEPLGTGRPRNVFLPELCDNCVADGASWSPTGRQVAVNANDGSDPQIWTVDARNGNRRRRLAKHGQAPDWSPDGRRVVYTSNWSPIESHGDYLKGGNLYVVTANGKRRRRLVRSRRAAAVSPTWSPDGRWIAYVRVLFGGGDVSRDIEAELWRVRSIGGRPKRLARLPKPVMSEGSYRLPHLAWQPRPRR